jgi:hypothetical protein
VVSDVIAPMILRDRMVTEDFGVLALGPVALKGKAQTTDVFAGPPRG